jgi:hypothetical protein
MSGRSGRSVTPPSPVKSALNGICAYFTMFPLEFPLRILQRHGQPGQRVLDPFCGRGTTNLAARLYGCESLGVDSSPVAAAITAAKLVTTTPDAVVAEAHAILTADVNVEVPAGEFWEMAYHPEVLKKLSRLRAELLQDCASPARIALRGVILGALHGPKQKLVSSYLSNQCPRTYAPKPAYAVRFWSERGLEADEVDILSVVELRAKRYFEEAPSGGGRVRLADSRKLDSMKPEDPRSLFDWVITSPPYYGMRTYVADQWLRAWFLGGPDCVDYSADTQLSHLSPRQFADDLRLVWSNAAAVTTERAKMVIRFGAIADRKADPLQIAKSSLKDSGWRITTICDAGCADHGKRQANAFLMEKSRAKAEYDIWAVRA